MNNESQASAVESIYDRRKIRRAFDKAAATYDEHAVLQKEVAARLMQRLDWLKLTPARVVDIGAGTGEPTGELMRRFGKAQLLAVDMSLNMLKQTQGRRRWFKRLPVVCADAQQLPLQDETVDMVFSSLALQWCDRPERVFAEVKRILKPDGVFIFSTFGPDTLKELRASWSAVDDAAHVHPFMDMHDIGDLLIYAGLQEPVMERDELTLTYENIRAVMNDVKSIGAGNALVNRPRGLMGKGKYRQLEAAYESRRIDGRLPATYEVIYGTVWSGKSNKPDVVQVPVEMIGRRRG